MWDAPASFGVHVGRHGRTRRIIIWDVSSGGQSACLSLLFCSYSMKKCSNCKFLKPLSDFNKWCKSKDGRNPRCRECQCAYGRQLYKLSAKRRAQVRKSDKSWRKRLAKAVWDYKAERGCADCGNNDPVVLEFDHVRGKKSFNVGNAVPSGFSYNRIMAEIKKCVVVCANCHRIRTFKRRVGRESEDVEVPPCHGGNLAGSSPVAPAIYPS